ncbi:MAG TPA: NAD-dependent epimerase/dehydratase family protein [Alphaproteobacteria bacterium]|nr:NAD-dependent epimerase/dehydratase family protein [Alphaproteobacteria bacterium]
MRILITGSSGFIGSHLKEKLHRTPSCEVFGLISPSCKNNQGIQCELTNKNNVLAVLRELQPNVIFHLAGSFSNHFSTDFNNNVVTTQNIIESIIELDIGSRLITIGSAAEYGVIDLKSSAPITETHPTAPCLVYGLTKLYQTNLCQFYTRTKDIDIVIARLFNVFGKGASEKLFVGKLEKKIIDYKSGKNKRIKLHNVNTFRDYLHVCCVSEELIKIMKYGIKGEIYNVGSGHPIQILELSKKILAEYELDESALELELDCEDLKDKDNVQMIYADISKIKSLGEDRV